MKRQESGIISDAHVRCERENFPGYLLTIGKATDRLTSGATTNLAFTTNVTNVGANRQENGFYGIHMTRLLVSEAMRRNGDERWRLNMFPPRIPNTVYTVDIESAIDIERFIRDNKPDLNPRSKFQGVTYQGLSGIVTPHGKVDDRAKVVIFPTGKITFVGAWKKRVQRYCDDLMRKKLAQYMIKK
jgi:hypothetical protein